MQSSHAAVHVSALFDEPNLIADAGLLPLVALSERVGLPELAARVRIEAADNSGGVHPAAKVMSLLGAMCSGADSIDDADRLRHGAMDRAFAGIRAPSTLGTFLRSFTHGHNRQLHRVHREFLARLAIHTPQLPGAGQLMFIDIDPTHRRVYGRAKQGAEHGRLKGQRTLHPIVATLSTPLARPVIGAVRLRRGKSADVRGAKSFAAQALAIAKDAGGTGIRMVRADSKFYTADVAAACHRSGAHFSLTTGMNPSIAAAIGRITEDAWVPIRYPEAFVDPDTGEMVSRRRGRRDRVHRVHRTQEGRAGHRPSDRAPGATPEPASSHRAGRVVRLLALPPHLHQQPLRHASGRTAPPATRCRGTGDRGRKVLRARPPALGKLPGERCLADSVGHVAQPAAGRRRPGLGLPRQGHHRHTPRPPDQGR
ncbi:transposase [Streptomyces sp. E11-3]|uniref:transposase n=1 Tax=Streptomyces sp. E11-3 TaxID=3110112 RepID=UPI003980422E